jgi:hypothetical protein
MNAGKTLFAQIMEFVPWKTFGRIVARHHSDAGTRKLSRPPSCFESLPFRN